MMTLQPRPNGFAAIAAIFLLLVLAALGAYMVSFSNSQQLNSAQDLQGSRAYWAARAGLEWAIASMPAGTTACFPTNPTALTIEGFSVSISCTPPAAPYTDRVAGGAAIGSVYIFQITATATSAGAVGSAGYVERSLSASLER